MVEPIIEVVDVAGYSGTPLLKKLGVKPGFRVALVGAPKNFKEELGVLAKLAGQGAEALVALDAALDDPAEDPAEEPARLSA